MWLWAQRLSSSIETLRTLPDAIQCFTSLRAPGIVGCDELETLPEWLGDYFTCLRLIYIFNRPMLSSLPESIRRLTELKKLFITNVPALSEKCQGEDSNKIDHIPEVIFKLADTGSRKIKQGYLAHKHALLVAKNLRLLIKGSPISKLETYSTGYPLALASLGRIEGLAQLPFLTLSGCLPGMIKSRDLFISKTRKQMGLNA